MPSGKCTCHVPYTNNFKELCTLRQILLNVFRTILTVNKDYFCKELFGICNGDGLLFV